ncbi:MAG: hypothetical protein A2X47_06330 [Lentisphaerae bacterium GWF2_38_69]|nr:MAG: hypothetical protein A2X47_06330 [Lentisphaerae bacterium GWF2_38_69]
MEIKLSTIIKAYPEPKSFTMDSEIAGIGSCFSQYVMEELRRLGFHTSSNPNGIVYNSHSILQSLKYLEKDYPEETFFQDNSLWHSWEHHGFFSSKSKEELIWQVNEAKKQFVERLKKARLFILTPSSSVVYVLKSSGRITANCHKVPNNNFSVEILSNEVNLANLKESISLIKNYNPDCSVIITLSPVRHYPGNLCLNSRSKANLLSAICECVEQTQNCMYFPSYEILLDELRDYRFYADDMLHPSNLARQLILDRFLESYFDQSSLIEIKERRKNLKLLNHRILQ